MKMADRFLIALKAIQELGPDQVSLFILYQLGLRTGHYQRELNHSIARLEKLNNTSSLRLAPCLPGLPERRTMLNLLGDQVGIIYQQADEIVGGKVRLFGGQAVPLVLEQSTPLKDWTWYEQGHYPSEGQDIKIIWEPARFGWACTLAMAYQLSGNERYSLSFWSYLERFVKANPPYLGPHWMSAQEAAIRLITLAFCLQAFETSATADQLELAARTISLHAERIPPTMVYARSQNNNHLIIEAAGLYTASALLPYHPLASKWHKLGWDWLLHGLLVQIDPDGTYIQYSTNYHRLMLQCVLWAFAVHDKAFTDDRIPAELNKRLKAATGWLEKLVDPHTGQVPNLGHNDGAYLLPLTACPFNDYRPVVHASALTFQKRRSLKEGAWMDMSYWLGIQQDALPDEISKESSQTISPDFADRHPIIILNRKNDSWASLCVTKYHARPAHADHLHMDLWWRGLNIALDPGTYSYNLPPPWDNGLCRAFVHNTVTVDGQDFMLRASKFLYLDWAKVKLIEPQAEPGDSTFSIAAQHDGYHKNGISSIRQVNACDDGRWVVIDRQEGTSTELHSARIHWLMPDWQYKFTEAPDDGNGKVQEIQILSPFGWIILRVSLPELPERSNSDQMVSVQIARAGELLYGSGDVSAVTGWVSPTYGEKLPALAFSLHVTQVMPITIKSEWILPDES